MGHKSTTSAVRPIVVTVLATAVLSLLLAGCAPGAATQRAGGSPGGTATPDGITPVPASVRTSIDSEEINLSGMQDIRFGESFSRLVKAGHVNPSVQGCAPEMLKIDAVSPVFHDGKLVLMWVFPPVHTPQGIEVGDSLAAARAAYPQATELTAPAGTDHFDGLLAADGDRAYLLLHDGKTIHKVIVGYTRYAELLFSQGFGTC